MRRRVIVCLGLLLVICLLGDAIALVSLQNSASELEALGTSHDIQSMRAALTASAARAESDAVARMLGRTPDEERGRERLARLEERLNACVVCHHAPAVTGELDEARSTFGRFLVANRRLPKAADDSAIETLRAEALSSINRLVEQAAEMGNRASRTMKDRSRDAVVSMNRAWIVLIVTIFVGLVAGGFIAWHLKNRLTKPVDELLDGIRHVRDGDLSYRFSSTGDEEFRTLADAFNRANEALKGAQDGILQAEKMAAVGRMTAGVAHEVGNPLSSISSIAQMMERRRDDDANRERARMIKDEVNRISTIIRDMLTFTRAPASDNGRSLTVHSMLKRALGLIQYDNRARGIDIDLDVSEDLDPIFGDPDRLVSVFTNIILNAFDAIIACEDHVGRLTVNARQHGHRVMVRFADNGVGMTEEQASIAFEPFFTTKEPGKGTGLGLWVCYQEVHRHGGTIRIESQRREGTTVTVELPTSDPATGKRPTG